MAETRYLQCQCGYINCTDRILKRDDNDIYINIYCEQCKRVTRQLYCGTNDQDLYYLYDVVSDPRHYHYNKTK